MKPTLSRTAATLLLVSALLSGCKKEGGPTSSETPTTGPTTQATAKYVVPQVGVPFITRDQYKPVPGKYGGRLVRSTLSEPKSFNPVVASETSTTDYTQRLFEGLTTSDPFTGETIPLLAEKWEVAADGVTWTFHLRKDVLFNDGSPFNAQDVVFTWNELTYDRSRPAGVEVRWPCSMRDITRFDGKDIQVEAIDDYTVKFVTPVKVAIMDQLVAGVRILSKKKYAPLVADGSFGSSMGANATSNDLVGTGPWMLKEYSRGQWIILKKNPFYWRKDAIGQRMPYLDELSFLITKDINTMLLNFQQQKSDLFALMSGKDVAALRPNQQKDNFTLYQLGADFATGFIAFNMNKEAADQGRIPQHKVKWFSDRRFRQAIAYGINRDAILTNVLRKLARPISAPFTAAIGQFKYDGFEPYPYDPAKAKVLLAEMGLKPNKEGILADEEGNKVSFTINTNSGNTNREQIADFVRNDLKQLGIEANTLFLEFNLMVDKINTRHDWECFVFSLTGSDDPHWGANVWKSNGRLHMWWPNQKTPATDWEKRIDEILAAGIQELDKTKRKAMYREFVEIAYREQPFVYTYSPERVVALRNKFNNVFPPGGPGQADAVIVNNEEELFLK